MTHTQNYNLSQWDPTDRILREDFNEDNRKLDAALDSLSRGKGNCVLYTTSYTGTGGGGQVNAVKLTFPQLPYVLIVSGGRNHMTLIQGNSNTSVSGATVSVIWDGNSVSWWSNGADNMMNTSGAGYRVAALMKAGD